MLLFSPVDLDCSSCSQPSYFGMGLGFLLHRMFYSLRVDELAL